MAAKAIDITPSHMIGAPSSDPFDITPNDDLELKRVVDGIYCGGEGTVRVLGKNSSEPANFTVLAGSIIPVRARKILSTGTTATGLVGL